MVHFGWSNPAALFRLPYLNGLIVLLLLPQASVEEHKASATEAAAQVENLKDEVAAAREVIHDKKNKAKIQKAELRVSTEGIVRDSNRVYLSTLLFLEQLEVQGVWLFAVAYQ